MDELEQLLRGLPQDLPFPEAALRARRCKGGRTQKVSLPHGFLDDEDALPAEESAATLDGG